MVSMTSWRYRREAGNLQWVRASARCVRKRGCGNTSAAAGADNTIVKSKGDKAVVRFVTEAKSSKIAGIVLLSRLSGLSISDDQLAIQTGSREVCDGCVQAQGDSASRCVQAQAHSCGTNADDTLVKHKGDKAAVRFVMAVPSFGRYDCCRLWPAGGSGV